MPGAATYSFDTAYRKSEIEPYESLVSTRGNGIPRLVRLFKSFTPQNTIYEHPTFESYRESSIVEHLHLQDYLSAPELKLAAHVDAYDAAVNAIVSFALSWNSRSRADFAADRPQYREFIEAVDEFARYENGRYVYGMVFEGVIVPYCKCAFKLAKSLFREPGAKPPAAQLEPFRLSHHLDVAFVEHLRDTYASLSNESLTLEDMTRLERHEMPIPYDLQHRIGNYDRLRSTAAVKFVTGQACSGKTTLLNTLRAHGWTIMSRGQLGAFSGKADNPVAVAALHAAIEFTMRHSDVLGDRSSIDNPLWVGIMELCNPKYERDLVLELLKFLDANLNEPSIGYYINQRGAVFIDPYPSLCAKRMMARGEGGDVFRCRLARYAIVQGIAYYAVARLFGWRVYFVPYTADKRFAPSRYAGIASELSRYFGRPDLSNPVPANRYARPPNDYAVSNEYPKSVGIYK